VATRILFGIGVIGETVKEIQLALRKNGCDVKPDRVFGAETVTALKKFQNMKAIPATGAVDETTWGSLMQRPTPACGERSLQLTAAFEGHGFELAVGNFDGALLTWGIIGFTMASGEVQAIVQAINTAHPELLDQAFGTHKIELLELMTAEREFQRQWAEEHTTQNGGLAEPWRSMFSRLGSFVEVQAEQIRHVREKYLQPAIATARRLGLASELGLALCFDIHVQNGGFKAPALKAIEGQSKAGIPELDLLRHIANTVADSAKPAWKEDVRRRKLTIATGRGKVHGHEYVLETWGLSGQDSADELASAGVRVA
jgi:hypothetical protein